MLICDPRGLVQEAAGNRGLNAGMKPIEKRMCRGHYLTTLFKATCLTTCFKDREWKEKSTFCTEHWDAFGWEK